MSTETEVAVDRLIRLFGAVLLSEDWPDRGYALREDLEPETAVSDTDPDWGRYGSLLRAG